MLQETYRSLLGLNGNAAVEKAIAEDKQESDLLLFRFLLVHWVVASTLMGIGYGTYLAGFVVGGVICGIAWAAYKFLSGTPYSSMVIASCFMLFSALYIQQNMGRIEMHFHIFAALALMTRYKSFLPLTAAVVTIASHHIIFNYCQQIGFTLGGAELLVFNYGFGWNIVFLHAAFVIFEAGFLGYVIMTLTRQFVGSIMTTENTKSVLDVLGNVIRTKDTSQQLDSSNEYAHVVNTLLDMINGQVVVGEALRNANTGLMIVDTCGTVVESNEAAQQLFSKLNDDFANQGVHIADASLKGTSVADMYKACGHSLDLDSIVGTETYELALGRYILNVTANPVVNDRGVRLGSIFEWEDITQQTNIQHEVQVIVDAARQGELDRRADLSGKTGFYSTLCVGINEMLDTVSTAMQEAVEVLSGLAEGDLSRSVTGQYQGQFSILKDSTNATIERLRDAVNEIKGSAETLSHTSSQLASTNQSLTDRTQEQVAGIEETAAAMMEMASNVKATAGQANDAGTSASGIREQVASTRDVSLQAVEAMGAINASSQQIVSIIDVIDEIAFQTNLLALNAAVEAARAGDKGRGFAVVATEVRGLAGRCATAAKEIKELIEESVSRVADGSSYVDRAGQSLTTVVTAVAEMVDAMEAISRSTQEQSEGINQVNSAMSSMEQATQNIAGMVSDAATASQSTGQQANQLRQLVNFFRLEAANSAQYFDEKKAANE